MRYTCQELAAEHLPLSLNITTLPVLMPPPLPCHLLLLLLFL